MTKVEGHAILTLKITDGKVEDVHLRGIEGSRYFEGLLVHRAYNEASWISARICGICSCGHTIAAIKAMENALGVQASQQTEDLRVLLTLGERIRSHAAHLYFLALPDYLGAPNAVAIAADKPDAVKMAVAMMKVGNDMVRRIGGRDMIPESATVGGWLHFPSQEDLDSLRARLQELRPGAVATANLFNSLDLPQLKNTSENFSLHNEKEYPVHEGTLKSGNREFPQTDFGKVVEEYHERDQTANFVVREGHTYMVGSLPRMANNFNQLSPEAKSLGGKVMANLDNPFYNNPAQAVELLDAFDQSIAMLGRVKVRPEPMADIKFKKCWGIAAIEVPRGTLWHEYELDDSGHISRANIITPTAQNLRSMEEAIKLYLPQLMSKSRQEVVDGLETLIRCYDPCLSCAAHFLRVEGL
jgi:coenzyme F420-reducing hydrogenase alpha subunit